MTGAPLPPLVEPGPALSPPELARYARHLSLPGIGVDGQRRLAAARVLLVGAGGLGSPAILYLAAAGVGTIGVVDDDDVDASNLQRQVLHGDGDVGRPKVESARDSVAEINPHVRFVAHRERLTPLNALDVMGRYDVVLDGADNFATRYLVSDAAEVLGLPVVWGSIFQHSGQVSVFWGAAPENGVTYRDVFPEPPPPGTVPDCATGGVLGAMCGSIGTAMAVETVKLVTGTGRTLLGRLAVHDALEATWRELTVRADPTREPVTALLEGPDAYAAFCGVSSVEPVETRASSVEPVETTVSSVEPVETTVAATEIAALLDDGAYLLDVREQWEHDIVAIPGAHLVPSGRFLGTSAGAYAALADLPTDRPVVVLCKVGARSDRVAQAAREAGVDARNVPGGILAWISEVAPHEQMY
ncbi:adenylyltransferase and sulfurtransferase [Paraoerskovia marina]|uniref:Adenylyltransferase and sulfurtransferase n=1 Tax=Paraoerskovia marina TaxID=545619 RepID=A0A1H1V4J9_9CELL|nr:ThiF family adenylyltransferase [Paraoerskovia marina]SDS79540.1 adenylyltransferase and sulfurtransferase [Paraoerskovia marina]